MASLSKVLLVAEKLKACVDFATIGSDELDIDGEAGIMAHVQARSNMLLVLMGAVAQKGLGSIIRWRTRCLLFVTYTTLANGVMSPFSMAFNEEGVLELPSHEQAAGVVKIINRWIITCGDRYPRPLYPGR